MSKAAAKKVENVEIELPVVPNPWAPTKPQSGQNDGPYFDKGHYLVEITAAKLNTRGNPFVSFQVKRSHDGRRVNQYYHLNFHMAPAKTPEHQKTKGQLMWEAKYWDLIQSLSVMSITGPDDLIEETVCMYISKTGESPIPNFSKANTFKTSTPTNVHKINTPPPVADMDAVKFDDFDEDSIPF